MDIQDGVYFPHIHHHIMMPWNNLKKGDCCGRLEAISDGYYCKSCDFFVHKKCGESPRSIEHPCHSIHPLMLQSKPHNICDLCERSIENLCYHCEICDFDVDIYCVRYPPPLVVEFSGMHDHKPTLLKERTKFYCAATCGKTGHDSFAYKCHECDLAFHVACVWDSSELKLPLEVNHSHHPLHPLKLLTGRSPEYSDEKCRLCDIKIDDDSFYHCSSCNFTLDIRCVFHPLPQSVLEVKAHDHQLTLLPRLDSFTCNACGLKGDRSPYICVQCNFMIHQHCLALPRIININRHDHRVSRTSVVGVVNSTCGICRHKVDWIWGGYVCQRCPCYVVHSKCATRRDVWNGKELEGVPEEIEDIEPYVVIDDNTIQHFSHKEHYLRLHVNGLLCEENKRCSACTHPICLQSFYYGCIDCCFLLHQKCAELPRRKWHVLHNERLTLITSTTNFFGCRACNKPSNGFKYQYGEKTLDALCGSISEPFFHPSHPDHPLYHTGAKGRIQCNACNKLTYPALSCIEKGCGFSLGFDCATLPQVVKHRVDSHLLSLCYGDKVSGKCWCDICEKETDPNIWFYTCRDQQASLHIKCVIGDLSGLMPRSTIAVSGIPNEVIVNDSMSRPFCMNCKSRCMYPLILKRLGTPDAYAHHCSFHCMVATVLVILRDLGLDQDVSRLE
ncbi:PREDICTED: uncharacterized protein LOC104733642 [Camelina sativa]|uniref:Uncharacterized protein LOC104733642 n=1 Tax=Camelina sativa TaxID=90675 RepID=A0ABM0V6A6_CAMSA|nr:PREDICTED: uncharacterized protein LOC104733642 [Camelina sativa]